MKVTIDGIIVAKCRLLKESLHKSFFDFIVIADIRIKLYTNFSYGSNSLLKFVVIRLQS